MVFMCGSSVWLRTEEEQMVLLVQILLLETLIMKFEYQESREIVIGVCFGHFI